MVPELLDGIDPSGAAGRGPAILRSAGARLLQRALADDLLTRRQPRRRHVGRRRARARVRPPRRQQPPEPAVREHRLRDEAVGIVREHCSKTAAGVLFPGAEDVARYSLNPGEAFAETYRVLNEQKLGLRAGGMEHRDADALSRRHCAQPARAGRAHAVDGAGAEGADGGADLEDPDADLHGRGTVRRNDRV